jgi:hypothetical protein
MSNDWEEETASEEAENSSDTSVDESTDKQAQSPQNVAPDTPSKPDMMQSDLAHPKRSDDDISVELE